MKVVVNRCYGGFGFDFDLNPELSRWWDDHKKADAAKAAAEAKAQFRKKMAQQLMELPLTRLTDEDKKLLREEGYL